VVVLVKWVNRSQWHNSWIPVSRLKLLSGKHHGKFVREFSLAQVSPFDFVFWYQHIYTEILLGIFCYSQMRVDQVLADTDACSVPQSWRNIEVCLIFIFDLFALTV
jgi:hypothetical protein